MMSWSDFEFVIHLACIIKTRILDIIWPCLLIIMIMTWLFSGISFICALVVSFAALALRARAANDTTQAQISNIPSKSHVIPLLLFSKMKHVSNWEIKGNSLQNKFTFMVLLMVSDNQKLRVLKNSASQLRQ